MYRCTNRLLLPELCLMALLLSSNSFALQTDHQQAIQVEADKASIHKKTGTSIYTGNVIVSQGSMIISADKLTIYTKQGKLDKFLAEGKPAQFQQTQDNQTKITASAEKMIYEARLNKVTFENNAELRQGQNTFSSNRIIYDINEDIVDAGKKSGGDRVIITIQPQAAPTTPDSDSAP